MNAACPRRVSLIIASGLPAIPSPTICGSAGTVPAVAGLSRRDRLRLALADSPNLADRIEFTATIRSDSLCYGLVVLSPLLSTPHCCDAVTVRYRTALHRTETDSHRSIPSPSQAHEFRVYPVPGPTTDHIDIGLRVINGAKLQRTGALQDAPRTREP